MTNQTLQYFMHYGPSAFRLELAGNLNSEGARRLELDLHTAASLIADRALIVDMTFVTGAAQEGRALLARWYAEGAQFVAKSKVSRELVGAIMGKPLSDSASAGNAGSTWLPFLVSFGAPKLYLMILLAALLLPVQSKAANLKAETVAAWEDYIQSVSATVQDRARPGRTFLWTEESADKIAKVHNGEILVAPAPGPNPRKVPGGLIHHWVAAAFLPNVKLNDILEVTQDYDRYKEFYQPSVIASNALVRRGSDDYFSMLLVNKAFLLKTALDADYRTTNVRLDDRRFYSISRTTRVQEIEDYGSSGEHRLPEGEGSGYIWRLFGIGRLEQRDGGVYIEMEAVALSREIPGLVRLVVDPIVRRVSRNALLISIAQTQEAVRCNLPAGSRIARPPASAEHISITPAVPKKNIAESMRVQ